MIFVTGDTHGDTDIDKLFQINEEYPKLSKQDYVIVAGDFGGCWNKKQLEFTRTLMNQLHYSILFVDGNHENFDLLNSYPIEEWNGGKVHKLFPDVIHLMRGEVFTIENKRILALGGAESTDRQYRLEHHSWWKQESITLKDVDNAINNLSRYDNKVDYVITHTMPSPKLYESYFYQLTFGLPHQSELMLDNIFAQIKFEKWYFGHWHVDMDLRENFHCLYNSYCLISIQNNTIDK